MRSTECSTRGCAVAGSSQPETGAPLAGAEPPPNGSGTRGRRAGRSQPRWIATSRAEEAVRASVERAAEMRAEREARTAEREARAAEAERRRQQREADRA